MIPEGQATMGRRRVGIPLLMLGILVMSGCLSTERNEPLPTCDSGSPPGGEVDAKEAGVRWLDAIVPIPYSLHDGDLQLETTWTFPEADFREVRVLQYYGFTRAGYMGGDWVQIGPTSLESNVATISLPTVSSVQAIARGKDIEDPVLHMFVMFSSGEPTMTLQGRWNGTVLTHRFGMDEPSVLQAQDFQTTPVSVTDVAASLPIPNPERMVALAFDAEETAGQLWRSPSYERPDGSSQAMKIPLLAEFSDLSGTWRFMMKGGIVSDPQQTVVWGTLFDPARAPIPEC